MAITEKPAKAKPTARAEAKGMLKALPRRPVLAHLEAGPADLQARVVEVPRASAWLMTRRAVRWMIAGARFALVSLVDRAQKKTGPRHVGLRLRQLFEQVGGTGIKIGQQLAVRVDFLPFETCQELGKLMDAVPAFDTDLAVQRIERLTGVALHQTFSEFQREPIGAASIACVWRARLHSGEQVAIKIRRPGVDALFAADLAMLDFSTRAAETLALVRPGFFTYLRTDLHDMFLGELDFAREADHQQLWRRYVKRDHIRWLSAPCVLADLSGPDILTTRFVVGYCCADVLQAIETDDRAALATLAAHDIDPRVVGARIQQIGMWGRMECAFFHADPHPGNIIVRPGNRIVMLDFGACATVTPQSATNQMEMLRRLNQDDISGGAAVTLAIMAPLPHIDTRALQRALEDVFWTFQIKMHSPDAEWWERTTAALWVWILEATRNYKLPINQDFLLFVRATLLYDTLACRLNTDVNIENAYKIWRKQAARRAQRRARRGRQISQDLVLQELDELGESVQRGLYFAGQLSRDLPKEFSAATSKSAFFASAMLKLGLRLSLVFTLVVGVAVTWAWWSDLPHDTLSLLSAVLSNPVVASVMVLLAILTLRAVRVRLQQFDPGEK